MYLNIITLKNKNLNGPVFRIEKRDYLGRPGNDRPVKNSKLSLLDRLVTLFISQLHEKDFK